MIPEFPILTPNLGAFAWVLGWQVFFRAILGADRSARAWVVPLAGLAGLCAAMALDVSLFAGASGPALLLAAGALALLDFGLPDLKPGWLVAAWITYCGALLIGAETAPLALWLGGAVYACGRRGPDGNPVPRARLALGLFLATPVVLLVLKQSPVGALAGRDPLQHFAAILRQLPVLALPLLALVALGWWRQRGDRFFIGACLGMSALCQLPGFFTQQSWSPQFALLFVLAACAPALRLPARAAPAPAP